MADSTSGTPNPFKSQGKFKEMTMETRLLLAFLLMGAVLFLTPYFIQQPPAPASTPAETKPEQPKAAEAKPAATQPAPSAAAPAKPAPAKPGAAAPAAVAAPAEQSQVIETDLYRVSLSNRGGVVTHWILKKFKDSSNKPLDLVNPAGIAKAGYPFSLSFKSQKPETDLNQALFVAKRTEDGLGIDFDFADGKVTARKSFRFTKSSYLGEISTQVVVNGVQIPHLVAWRGGFGDSTVMNYSALVQTLHYETAKNSLEINEAKAAADGPVSVTGQFAFAGVQDAYFAAVFLPRGNPSFELMTVSDQFVQVKDGKDEPHAGAGVGGDGANRFALFVGPKDVEILKSVDPKLEGLIDYGWFWWLAKPLFSSLKWTNGITSNWGWAIVLVTVAINFLLLPLKVSSLKSMRKMSALQPELQRINDKYKGLSMRDPKKADQNQEVMDLYKKNGVNPAGGCVPLLLQLPFFFGFYKVLSTAIELRGAPWLWVGDLAQPETLAIRVLPLLMIVSQFVMTKMTPATSPDPAQQKMMLMMPLIFGFMFYSVSSGLVLYWLTGNLVGIVQQWFFNRMMPAPAVVAPPQAQSKNKPRK